MFYQLYYIHAYLGNVKNRHLPLVNVLMTNKTEENNRATLIFTGINKIGSVLP